jgi:hypothetical protein
MDQVRMAIGQLVKYHFWILCVVVVGFGITGWYIATGGLDAESKKNADQIKAQETAITQVLKIQDHPNAEFAKGMEEMIHRYAVGVGLGWRERYRQQEKLLVWPKRLGTAFHQQVNTLRPIEEKVGFDEAKGYVDKDEIPVKYREIYRNFIVDELPELAKIIGAKWYASFDDAASTGSSGRTTSGGKSPYSSPGGKSSRPPGMSGSSSPYRTTGRGDMPGKGSGKPGETTEEVDNSIVFWTAENQREILEQHFKFAAETATPHTLDVLYAQEDLWVLEAILRVIERTNAGADANYNAAIKEIESIEMGRTVRGRMGKVSQVQDPLSTANPNGGAPGVMPGVVPGVTPGDSTTTSSTTTTMAPTAMPGSVPGSTTSGTPTGPLDPALGRYVDIDYNPLPPKSLRAARTTDDPALAIYSVAKRMPVRLRLRMDQRRLNDLLAECGNSSLPIEVRQVRINCEAGLVNDIGAMPGSGGQSSSSYGNSYSMPSTSSSSAAKSSSSARSRRGTGEMTGPGYGSSHKNAVVEDPNEVVVEVFGIVYIFNPVNEKQLNIELQRDAEGGAATPTAAVDTKKTSPQG